MKTVDFVKKLINQVLKSKIISEIVKNNKDVKIYFDSKPHPKGALGGFYAGGNFIVIRVDSYAKIINENDDVNKWYTKIQNTFIHEYRHARQFKIMSNIFGKENALMLWQNRILSPDYDYNKDDFEIDAFRFSERMIPSHLHSSVSKKYGEYISQQVANACLLNILQAIKQKYVWLLSAWIPSSDKTITVFVHECYYHYVSECPSCFFPLLAYYWNSS